MLVLGIIFLFICTGITPSVAVDTVKKPSMPISNGKTLYVGGTGEGNYTKIQDAINDASDGDTIYVFSGIYNEWIRLHKQLFIKGIKKQGEDYPIINGGDDHDTVIIYADGCSFEDFKVRNGEGGFLETGITLHSNNNVINNCESYHTGTGLYLVSSCNNTISNNHCHGGHRGFQIRASNNNTFFNNRINDHNNHEVEFDEGSENNLFINNTVLNCGSEEGIELVNSDNNIFLGNNISYNCRGLVIGSSENISVRDNVFWRDGIILSGTIEEQTSHTIENNLVNGKPLYYYGSKTGISVPEDAGQIILINCSYFTIKNCKLISVDYGIRLTYSSNNTIIDNSIISTGPAGIKLSSSHNNLISRNYIRGCSYGIYLTGSNNNVISYNDVERHSSHVGIYIKSSSDNKICNNNINHSKTGVFIWMSDDNEISKNNVIHSTYGISLLGSSYSSVVNNIVIDSVGIGIDAEYAKFTNIKKNHVTDSKIGIRLDHANFIFVSRNYVSENEQGIKVSGTMSVIHRNHIKNNLGSGISLDSPLFIVITKNNFIGNNPNAIFSNYVPFIRNRWFGNYWDDNFILPGYRIKGEIVILIISVDPFEPSKTITYSWFNFDWRPALLPNLI